MKIVAGLGSIDDYVSQVMAGADEMFIGFVPNAWNKKYGNIMPLNRREVLFYNVQIPCYSEMKILSKMIDRYKVPVTVAFNSLYYTNEQYLEIEDMIKKLMDIGFYHYIISDIGLILHLRNNNINCNIHLSGEAFESNSITLNLMDDFYISRYIFHRKMTINEMNSCINRKDNIEYEAFILNERCHYTGAFCNSLHTDELDHLCKINYKLASITRKDIKDNDILMKYKIYQNSKDNLLKISSEDDLKNKYIVGDTGCGLCNLRELDRVGITHLKVVGRGNYKDYMINDIKALKKALKIMEKSKSNEDFKKNIITKFFNNKCSKNCYY